MIFRLCFLVSRLLSWRMVFFCVPAILYYAPDDDQWCEENEKEEEEGGMLMHIAHTLGSVHLDKMG